MQDTPPTSVKRYVVFAGRSYDYGCGWGDNRGSYDTPQEAIAAINRLEREDWAHIVDLETGEKVNANDQLPD